MAKGRAIEGREFFVEAAHFLLPLFLDDEGLRAYDEDAPQFAPCMKLAQNQPGLDGFSDADFICNKEPWSVGPKQTQNGAVLIRDMIDTALIKRER